MPSAEDQRRCFNAPDEARMPDTNSLRPIQRAEPARMGHRRGLSGRTCNVASLPPRRNNAAPSISSSRFQWGKGTTDSPQARF